MINNHLNVVIDTNCLIQILGRRTRYRRIWNAFLQNRFVWSMSNEIVHEYEEILSMKFSPQVVHLVMQVFSHSPNIVKKDPYFSFGLITVDVDDNKFVDCAIASGAFFIVTEDSHFDCLSNISFPYVQIITLDEFDHMLFPSGT